MCSLIIDYTHWKYTQFQKKILKPINITLTKTRMKPKLIETPEKLWDMFKEYKEYIITNPRTIEKALQSGKIAKESLRVPLTMEGFELYCLENYSDCHHYFDNTDNRYSEYGTICSRIKKSIRNDQIEGGMVGQYNPSITQRLNNLTEKTDITTDGKGINEIKVNIIKSNPTTETEL